MEVSVESGASDPPFTQGFHQSIFLNQRTSRGIQKKGTLGKLPELLIANEASRGTIEW